VRLHNLGYQQIQSKPLSTKSITPDEAVAQASSGLDEHSGIAHQQRKDLQRDALVLLLLLLLLLHLRRWLLLLLLLLQHFRLLLVRGCQCWLLLLLLLLLL
jgi:hypothetical protein